MQEETVNAMTAWTDEQLLLAYRDAFINGWGGTQRMINGRSIQFATPDKLLDIIERLEARIADASDDDDGTNGGVALAVFGTPR